MADLESMLSKDLPARFAEGMAFLSLRERGPNALSARELEKAIMGIFPARIVGVLDW